MESPTPAATGVLVEENPEVPLSTEIPALDTPKPTLTVEQVESGIPSGSVVFRIAQEESEVRFTIYEELRGQPKYVVGTRNQVAGEISVNTTDLSQTRVGVILVSARTLATDDDRRNQAIRNRILFTDQYEYLTFTPNRVLGLTGEAVPEQSYTFQIAGDLTVAAVTQPVAFDVTVMAESMDRLVGSATTTILLANFNLIIPSVPFVANVGNEVKLAIDFVLVPAQPYS